MWTVVTMLCGHGVCGYGVIGMNVLAAQVDACGFHQIGYHQLIPLEDNTYGMRQLAAYLGVRSERLTK